MSFMIGLRGPMSLPWLVVLLWPFQAPGVAGQTASTGALMGVVVDRSGARVVGARVEIKESERAVTRAATCDREGLFVLSLLPPGDYLLTASKSGFAQARPITVKVSVAESVSVLFPMKVAGITQEITVKSDVSAEVPR